ncbi:conserved hypothetical protein, secreted [Candidatus Magnetomorum sp. HK-1]|nr:conserved hypothetical protein, secreted [Candidatus Magnetomorum sp. HK-1]
MQNLIEKRRMSHKMFVVIILFISISLALSIPAYCDDAVYKEEFNIILKQLDDITERIEKIEDKNGISEKETLPEEKVEELKTDVDDFLDILNEVEKKSIVDQVELKAELRTRFDWFDFKGHDNIKFTDIHDGPLKHEKVSGLPSNRLRLNLHAEIASWLRFHSRLSMYHIWADDDYPVYPESTFINQSRIPSDISLKVERVYADVFFEPIEQLPMALTFGRLPTTDGFPTNLREDTARKSTYPNMAYDVETDGIGLSVDLSHFTGLKQSAYRLVYLRRCEDTETVTFGKKITDKRGIYRVDEFNVDDLGIYISQFETLLPGIFRDTIFLINLVYIPKTPTLDMRFSDDLYPFYYDSTGLLYIEEPSSIGHGWKATCYIESKNFLNLHMDAFIGAAYIKTKAEGATKFMLNPSVIGLPGPPVEARKAYETYQSLIDLIPNMEPLLKQLQGAPPPVGLINDDGTSDRDAYAIHIGFRYQLPLQVFHKPKLGVEYNHGSRYWLGFSDASEDPIHKLSTRGSVWDLYYIQPVNRYLTFRLGYTDIQQDYDFGVSFYFGNPNEIDHHIKNVYFLMDARF